MSKKVFEAYNRGVLYLKTKIKMKMNRKTYLFFWYSIDFQCDRGLFFLIA